MSWGTIIAVISTVAVLSFLYRDNPFYRLAEQILIGLSVGFSIVLVSQSVLWPKLLSPLFRQGHVLSVIPFLLALSMFLRLRSSLSRLSKPALALMIGSGAGVSIPAMFDARVLKQLAGTVEPFTGMGGGGNIDVLNIVSAIVSLLGVITVMVYFFYTRADNKPFRGISRVGVYFLMIFFGATFGYTVTSRLTLLIGRMEFLLGDFLKIL